MPTVAAVATDDPLGLATDAVERLVLIGATPGIEDPDERAARRDADDRRSPVQRGYDWSDLLESASAPDTE